MISASRSSKNLPRSWKPSASPTTPISTCTAIRGSARPSTRSPSPALTMFKAPATRPVAAAFSSAAPTAHADEENCAREILVDSARRAYRRPVTDADLKKPMDFYPKTATARSVSSAASKWPSAPFWSTRDFSSASSRIRIGLAPKTAYRISDLELASRASRSSFGAASPTTSCSDWRHRRRSAASPRCSNAKSRRMLADPRSRHSRHQLRRPVAAPAQSRIDHAGPATLPRLRRQPSPGIPQGNRTVLRERHARRPQRARPPEARTTLSSTNGLPSTTASRMSTAAASAASTSRTTCDAAACSARAVF